MQIIVPLLIAGAMAYWVYQDSGKRYRYHSLGWATGTFLAAIVFLPLYLLMRPPLRRSAQEAGAGAVECPRCAVSNPGDAAFCRGCGEQLRSARMCPRCGREAGPGDRYCCRCGASLFE